jgi:hypothetical protein
MLCWFNGASNGSKRDRGPRRITSIRRQSRVRPDAMRARYFSLRRGSSEAMH